MFLNAKNFKPWDIVHLHRAWKWNEHNYKPSFVSFDESIMLFCELTKS